MKKIEEKLEDIFDYNLDLKFLLIEEEEFRLIFIFDKEHNNI